MQVIDVTPATVEPVVYTPEPYTPEPPPIDPALVHKHRVEAAATAANLGAAFARLPTPAARRKFALEHQHAAAVHREFLALTNGRYAYLSKCLRRNSARVGASPEFDSLRALRDAVSALELVVSKMMADPTSRHPALLARQSQLRRLMKLAAALPDDRLVRQFNATMQDEFNMIDAQLTTGTYETMTDLVNKLALDDPFPVKAEQFGPRPGSPGFVPSPPPPADGERPRAWSAAAHQTAGRHALPRSKE